MLIPLLTICSITLCYTISPIQGGKTDLDRAGLKGRVKSFSYYVFKPEGLADNRWSFKSITIYNNNGYILSFKLFSTKDTNKVAYAFNNIYDSDNRLKAIVHKDGETAVTYNYSFNSKHCLIQMTAGQHYPSSVIIYNKQGQRDTAFMNDVAGKLVRKLIYYYDKAGNMIAVDQFKRDSVTLDRHEEYRYNAQRHVIEENYYNGKHERFEHVTYEYDKNGNRLAEIDSNRLYIGGVPCTKIGDKIYKREYRYPKLDSYGNWTRQECIANGKVVQVAGRMFEYY